MIGKAGETYITVPALFSSVIVAVPAPEEYTSIELSTTSEYKSNNSPAFCVVVVTVGKPWLAI